jgi:hypothetical protein
MMVAKEKLIKIMDHGLVEQKFEYGFSEEYDDKPHMDIHEYSGIMSIEI